MWCVVVLLACLASAPPSTPPRVVVGKAIRLVRTGAGVVVEVASDRYRSPEGADVWVVGSIHVADPVLYEVARARLSGAERVLLEGMVDDMPSSEPAPAVDAAAALGLARQGEVPVEPGWARVDVSDSEVAAWMRADGVDESLIHQLLVEGPTHDATLPEDPRRIAIARLRLAKALTEPDGVTALDIARKEYLIGRRDELFVDAITETPSDSVAAWYGCDHVPGVGQGLLTRGYVHQERAWVPALSVGYSELELGPVQVDQILRR